MVIRNRYLGLSVVAFMYAFRNRATGIIIEEQASVSGLSFTRWCRPQPDNCQPPVPARPCLEPVHGGAVLRSHPPSRPNQECRDCQVHHEGEVRGSSPANSDKVYE